MSDLNKLGVANIFVLSSKASTCFGLSQAHREYYFRTPEFSQCVDILRSAFVPALGMLFVILQTLFDLENWIRTDYGVDKYDIGTGFGHFGIAVDDVRSVYCTEIPKHS